MLGEKALTALRLAALPPTSPERQSGYDAACAQYSEKAMLRVFESLVRRGYMECGVSARTGWLTSMGCEELGLSIGAPTESASSR